MRLLCRLGWHKWHWPIWIYHDCKTRLCHRCGRVEKHISGPIGDLTKGEWIPRTVRASREWMN